MAKFVLKYCKFLTHEAVFNFENQTFRLKYIQIKTEAMLVHHHRLTSFKFQVNTKSLSVFNNKAAQYSLKCQRHCLGPLHRIPSNNPIVSKVTQHNRGMKISRVLFFHLNTYNCFQNIFPIQFVNANFKVLESIKMLKT